MSKKIAVINDLSGLGRCSLTAAIPVLSVMGVSPCPLPTAVLTAQTGYPSYYCDDLTDKMDIFTEEWKKQEVAFSGIYTGFLANTEQVDKIFHFLDAFYNEDNFLLVDPVMGDNGETYPIFTDTFLQEMKRLCEKADILTPNLTEACLLANSDYQQFTATTNPDDLLDQIATLGRKLLNKPNKHVIITGIHLEIDQVPSMGNLHVYQDGCNFSSYPCVHGSYSGTGDLFASCLTGGIARGEEIKDIIETAAQFIGKSLIDTKADNTPTIEGVNFEANLGMLIPSFSKSCENL